jgi:hypothetical protein
VNDGPVQPSPDPDGPPSPILGEGAAKQPGEGCTTRPRIPSLIIQPMVLLLT